MEIACIVRCIGVAVFAVSLQAGAQPPEGKGKPEHAGTSPFIRFPVPQHSVGVVHQSQGAGRRLETPGLGAKTFNDLPSPRGKSGSGEVIAISTSKTVDAGSGNVKAAKVAQVSFALSGGGSPASEKKALPECGAR